MARTKKNKPSPSPSAMGPHICRACGAEVTPTATVEVITCQSCGYTGRVAPRERSAHG